jgi:hypothetical protein
MSYASKKSQIAVVVAILVAVSVIFALVFVGEGPEPDSGQSPATSASYILPTEAGAWVPEVAHNSSLPSDTGSVTIENVGVFTFEATEVETLRPDIFRAGHYSVFDVVAHLAKQGDIELTYHFDDSAGTHIIETINGQNDWWYTIFYSGGWSERIAFRMDMFPYKDGATIRLFRDQNVDAIYTSFREEVSRLEANEGKVIIPEVRITGSGLNLAFSNVEVQAYGLRTDVLQSGVVTAMDVLLSLAEQGKIERLKLTWYDRIGRANPVETYFTEQINDVEARGRCGFVYEAGPHTLSGSKGNHIHLPSDVRVIISPEYALWFWICI